MSSTDTPEAYQRLKTLLGDREWRLDNLYWIQNENGEAVKFIRNEAQRAFWSEVWYLNAILKARQLGFSTYIAILQLDACLFNSNTAAGIIDLTMSDAKKKLSKVRFAYNHLPARLREALPYVRENTEAVEWANGSRIEIGTSHRGGTLQQLHVSEYGKISARFPETAHEIKKGAFGTVHAGQVIHVESTAEGQGGEFYELVQRAEAQQKENRPLSQLDFKLHFFAWWRHNGYRLNPAHVQITPDVKEYFDELAGKHGISIDHEQQAWYAAKRRQIGPDDIFSEYPSIPDEAFQASIEGAYFKSQMSKARIDGRIGHMPHDSERKVNTWWDVGNDTTSIWFHQTDGLRHRFIDYYENSGESIGHYIKVIEQRKADCGYRYGKHLGPHDFSVKDWGGTGKTRVEIARSLGLEVQAVPRVDDKADAIEAGRDMLGMSWFDAEKCHRGIQCLDNYRKEWNEQLGVWRDKPRHDFASHGADSYMTGATGWVPERIEKRIDRHRAARAQPQSAWGV